MSQVVTNLFDNALDASASQVTVKTTAAPHEVLLEITDDGAGIPPTRFPESGSPSITTKPPGLGTGIGLANQHAKSSPTTAVASRWNRGLGERCSQFISRPIRPWPTMAVLLGSLDPSMVSLPTGTVTFLFTDIEGSTRLLQRMGDAYSEMLDTHSSILKKAIESHSGIVVSTEGDSFFAVFTTPDDAIASVVDFQRGLEAADWNVEDRIAVRSGIHTGEGTIGGDNYVGLDVHRAARIAAAGHGGQVLVSNTTTALVQDHLPEGVSLRSMGKHRLKDLTRPEALHQLVIEGLRSEFPPLKTLDFVPNNLPVELTSFVARGEVAQVVAQMEDARIVTLTGPGGTGKTRLSLQVAAELTRSICRRGLVRTSRRHSRSRADHVGGRDGSGPAAFGRGSRRSTLGIPPQQAACAGSRQLRAGDRGGSSR